ncbi:MAG TPA: sigma-54 dependent transcriptional regulator [Kofleriaceae bacterium]|nr:sigma-54 dependent transcriptional regulator [Kofleriaceae bacterium]
MSAVEHFQIVACATGAATLARLVDAIGERGGWRVVPICWPDPAALAAASAVASAFVVHAGDEADGELAAALAERQPRAPLIVVGPEPMRRAAPTLWLPAPAPGLLARLLAALVDGGAAAPVAPPVRRKTDMIIGDSPAIRELVRALDRLAVSDASVLITGESGVGKELAARTLHYGGPRASARFIAINCAAIAATLIEAELFGVERGAFTDAVDPRPGAIEAAHGGTLFLDEIGDMPLAMQAKLLRVLETGEVQRVGSSQRRQIDFRLVTATHRNLERAIADGQFREDLYYRVHVVPLHVPALRDRPEDIPRLAGHYLAVIAQRERRHGLRLAPAALEKLIGYGWPGNVRELVSLLERAVLLAGDGAIDAEHVIVPGDARAASAALPPYRDAKARFELEYYTQLMRTAGGNVSLAARLGKKTRKEIYGALRRCGLPARRPDGDEPIASQRRRRA